MQYLLKFTQKYRFNYLFFVFFVFFDLIITQFTLISYNAYAQNPPTNPYYGSSSINYMPSCITYGTECNLGTNTYSGAMQQYDKQFKTNTNPVLYAWVSLAGESKQVNTSVNYGSITPISLQLNWAYMFFHTSTNGISFPEGYHSKSPITSLVQTGFYVQGITANYGNVSNNLDRKYINISSPNPTNNIYYKYGMVYSVPFTYYPPSPGGITGPVIITANFQTYNAWHKNPTQYFCDANGNDANGNPATPNSLSGVQNCPISPEPFIIANPIPPPTISSGGMSCSLNPLSNAYNYTINNFDSSTQQIQYQYSYNDIFINNEFGGDYTSSWYSLGNSSGSISLPTTPGKYNLTLRVISIKTGRVLVGSSFASDACPSFPYFQVNRSDTQVGLGFCNISNNAPSVSIKAWNHNGLPNNYSQGAGDQYGAIAPGFLSGFDSANINQGTNPLGLSFSNVNNPSSQYDNSFFGLFGGYFGSLPPCGHNYFPSNTSSLSQISQYVNPSWWSTTSGNYYVNGSFNINGPITIPQGVNVNLYVNGNVYINRNIIQPNNLKANKVSQLSSFKLVVEGGDIIISPNVSEIDGVYVAEPDSNVGGTIYTCGNTHPTNNCNTQLIVNGSLVANTINLWRTYGDTGWSPSSFRAETINQPPSEWLSSFNNPGSSTIDSIRNLPPVF